MAWRESVDRVRGSTGGRLLAALLVVPMLSAAGGSGHAVVHGEVGHALIPGLLSLGSGVLAVWFWRSADREARSAQATPSL